MVWQLCERRACLQVVQLREDSRERSPESVVPWLGI